MIRDGGRGFRVQVLHDDAFEYIAGQGSALTRDTQGAIKAFVMKNDDSQWVIVRLKETAFFWVLLKIAAMGLDTDGLFNSVFLVK